MAKNKTKTNKALLITSIVLTVIAVVGLIFSLSMAQAVEDLLHPDTGSEAAEGETDAGEQAGRAIASVFVAILVLPIWLLIEVITLAFDIPSLVMSSTLCGRLAHDRKTEKQSQEIEAAPAEPETTDFEFAPGETETPKETTESSPKSGKGMLIASVVMIVLNVAIIATLVITTISVIA